MATNVVLVVVVVVLGVVILRFQCTTAFSFHNRSSLNFAYRLKTIPHGRHLVNRNEMCVSGSDSYALLFLLLLLVVLQNILFD